MDSYFGKVVDAVTELSGDSHSGQGGVYSKATLHLGIDPLAEKELLWIAQHATTARLPPHWVVKTINRGEEDEDTIYLNEETRVQRKESPILSRCRKLVQLFRSSRVEQMPLDEVSVLELLDPILEPAAVLSMCAYLGIKIPTAEDSTASMINWESHLVWVAKLAVLDELPDGWEEVVTEGGDDGAEYTVQYIKKDGDEQLLEGEHPNDDGYRTILARERARRPPKQVLFREMYEYGAIRFRRNVTFSAASSRGVSRSGARLVHGDDKAAAGTFGEERLVPALGLYIDLYDSAGTKYFYHVLSGATTYDVDVVRREPAALVIQRSYRGYRERCKLQMTSHAARRIQACWRTFKYRRALRIVSLSQSEAATIIQRCWRTHAMSVRASRECFRKLAELKEARRPGRIDYSKVSGLLGTSKSFRSVLRSVINVQRHYRAVKARRLAGESAIRPSDETSIMVEKIRREEQRLNALEAERMAEERAATHIQAAFRGMQDRRRVDQMRRAGKEAAGALESANGDAEHEDEAAEADGESGRVTPLPERKIVTLMNTKASVRPKSRGKTPKATPPGSKRANSGGNEDVPQPSKAENGAEVLVLPDADEGGGDGAVDDASSSPSAWTVGSADREESATDASLLPSSKAGAKSTGAADTKRAGKEEGGSSARAAGSGDGSGSKHGEGKSGGGGGKGARAEAGPGTSSATVAKTGNKERTKKTGKARPVSSSTKKKAASGKTGATKPKVDSSKAGLADGVSESNTVSARTKLKAPTPTTPRASRKPKEVAKAEPSRPFGRSTIIASIGVKQIKIGSLFVSPIGAVKRTHTPDKMVAGTDLSRSVGRGSRPKTPSRMRSAKKKLDVDATSAELAHGAAAAGNGTAADNGLGAHSGGGAATKAETNGATGIGVSYPSPSSSRATSSRASSRETIAKKNRKKATNGAAANDDDDDDMDLFQKIKEQRLRTENMLRNSQSAATASIYANMAKGKTSPTRRLKRI